MGPGNLAAETLVGGVPGESGSGAQALLEANVDQKVGVAKLGWQRGMNTYVLTIKGAVDDASGQAQPLSLDGLAPSGAAKLALTHLFAPGIPHRGEIVRRRLAILKRECTRAGREPLCDVSELPEDVRPRVEQQVFGFLDHLWLLNFGASLARNRFKYAQGLDSPEVSVERNSWSVEARAGLLRPSFGALLASFTHSRLFAPGGSASQVCRPIAVGSSTLRCASLTVGAPRATQAHTGRIELRRFVTADFAIAPSVERDFKARITQVSLPVYFLKSEKGGLNGGVRVSWRSDTQALAASVFVGAAPSLLD